MRILSMTAGAAGAYAGSCLRDNALAAELLAQGHDVHLVPLSTPTRCDERNVSDHRVLFGRISVQLQHASPLFRYLPHLVDRVWDSPAVIGAFADRLTATDPALLGRLAVSMLRGRHGPLWREFGKLRDWARGEPPPDIVNLPGALFIALAAPLREAFGRPVCCTLQGEQRFLDALTVPYRDEAIALIREQVPQVDRFIAVSEAGRRVLQGLLQIPDSRISVVPLGIDPAGYRRASSSGPFRVGYLARVAPEKGLHVLADAYTRFRALAPDADARLDAAGYLSPAHERYLERVRNTLAQGRLADEFTYHGEVDRAGKIAFLRRLDVFSMPAGGDEAKGIPVLEAMASGVPVVQPRRGAIVELVERTGGGVLVPPGGPDALAAALFDLWRDRPANDALARRAYDGVRAHYTVARSAARLLEVYGDVAARAK